MMKRVLLILLAVLSTVACRKITPEDRIAQISDYFKTNENTYAEDLHRHEGQKRLDYLTLKLAKDINAEDIWTLENEGENSLVAEFPGREGKKTQFSLLSASLDDPDACAVVLNTLQAFKDLKINPKGTIRALFYSPLKDTAGISGLSAVFREIFESGELVTFEMEVASRDTLPGHTFFLDEKPVFAERLLEVVPPYLSPLGDYRLEQGEYPNPEWPVKASVYRYYIDPSDLKKESAVISAFSFLVN